MSNVQVQIPGSMAGRVAKVEQQTPVLNQYQKARRIDLEYAIAWNKLKGANLPEIPKDADKETLVKFCEIYKVNMDHCQTYVDIHNMVRISRPPFEQEKPKEVAVNLAEMHPAQIKSHLKKLGIEVPESANTKEELLALLPKD